MTHAAMMHPSDDLALTVPPSYPVYVDRKIDGYRMQAVVSVQGDDGTVVFRSRGGFDYPALAPLKAPLLLAGLALARQEGRGCATYIVDAEVSCGSLAATAAVRGNRPAEQARLFVFDLLAGDGGADVRPLSARRGRMGLFLAGLPAGARQTIVPVPSVLADTPEQVDALYAAMVADGAEGVVIKAASSLYRGGRSTQWRKRKPVRTADYPVTGLIEGVGKCAGTLGAIVINCDGLPLVVGAGFDADERRHLWAMGAGLIGRLIEVSYLTRAVSGLLIGASFIRVRDDLCAAGG